MFKAIVNFILKELEVLIALALIVWVWQDWEFFGPAHFFLIDYMIGWIALRQFLLLKYEKKLAKLGKSVRKSNLNSIGYAPTVYESMMKMRELNEGVE